MSVSEWVVLCIVAVVIYLSWKRGSFSLSSSSADSTFICSNCGTRGRPTTRTRGSFFIELILWICLIIPGLIYSIWRLTTRHKVCPACGHETMISVSSPRGKQLTKQLHPGQPLKLHEIQDTYRQ
jgi:hypothetical protein